MKDLRKIKVNEALFDRVVKFEHLIVIKVDEHNSVTLLRGGGFGITDFSNVINAPQFTEIARIHAEILKED